MFCATKELLVSGRVDVAVKACYDVRESSAFWQKLALRSQLADERVGDYDDAPQWLSTHPDHESRAKKLDGMIPAVSVVNILLALPLFIDAVDRVTSRKDIWPAKISPAGTIWRPTQSFPGVTV